MGGTGNVIGIGPSNQYQESCTDGLVLSSILYSSSTYNFTKKNEDKNSIYIVKQRSFYTFKFYICTSNGNSYVNEVRKYNIHMLFAFCLMYSLIRDNSDDCKLN